MSIKLYSKSYKVDFSKMENLDKRFTADEHTYFSKFSQDVALFETRCEMLECLAKKNGVTINRLVEEVILGREVKSVISLGSGSCYNEYLWAKNLPALSVFACDFDSSLIEQASRFLVPLVKGNLSVHELDFTSCSFVSFLHSHNFNAEMVVFAGSAYVMDDREFVGLFKELRKSNVKYILDLHDGCVGMRDKLSSILKPLTSISWIRKLFCQDAYVEQGKFHGYGRSRSEIRLLYQKAGWNIDDEKYSDECHYIAMLS
jgi:hypothetical protein